MQYKFGHTQDLFLRDTPVVLCAALSRLNKEEKRREPSIVSIQRKDYVPRGKCVMRNDVERRGDVGFMSLHLPVRHLHCFVRVHLLSKPRHEEIWVALRR
jgi:hypothetical protein